MSANCATWTSERIELLKHYLQSGLSCGQIAREIGVTRNAVIGKRSRLGVSRPKDVIGRQLEQRRAARLARPKTPRTWRPRRARLNIFAQHEMLMAAFPSPQPPAEDIPIYNGRGCTLLELSQLKWAAGRSAARAPTTSASAGTSQSKDCPIAWDTRASRTGRSAAQQRGCVSDDCRAASSNIWSRPSIFIRSMMARPRRTTLCDFAGGPPVCVPTRIERLVSCPA